MGLTAPFFLNDFFKTIHSTYESLQELIQAEDQLLKETNAAHDTSWYNMCTSGRFGGDGTGIKSRNFGVKKSLAHRKALGDSKRGKPSPFKGLKRDLSIELRKYLSERQLGTKSPVYDRTQHDFINIKTGGKFTGTQYQFRNTFSFDSGNVNKLIKGKITSFHNWIIQGTIKAKHGRTPETTIYTISDGLLTFSGNRQELKLRLNTDGGNISKLVTGKKSSHKGWYLVK